jgi:isoquinoline 1-oxidoreductase
LGGALTEEMRFKEGRILNPSFGRYRVPRFKAVPPIETVLLDRRDLASVGAGETPIIAIAPAIANALANATQVRVRSLPIRNDEFHCA